MPSSRDARVLAGVGCLVVTVLWFTLGPSSASTASLRRDGWSSASTAALQDRVAALESALESASLRHAGATAAGSMVIESRAALESASLRRAGATAAGSMVIESRAAGVAYVRGHVKEFNTYLLGAERTSHPHLVLLMEARMLICLPPVKKRVILDVGANVGQRTDSAFWLWGRQQHRGMLGAWRAAGVRMDPNRIEDIHAQDDPTVHMFEPLPSNAETLRGVFERSGNYPKGRAIVNNVAVAAKPGTMTMYDGGGCDDNKYKDQNNCGNTAGGLTANGRAVGKVRVVTLDGYLREHAITQTMFAKIDVEGWEMEVFLGMADSLRSGAIDIVTFEFGHKWTGEYRKAGGGVKLKRAADFFEQHGLATFMIGERVLVPVSGRFYDAFYEQTDFQHFVSVEMLAIRKTHPSLACMTQGFVV